MGLIKQAGDLVYTFRFITLLVTPFNKTKAYEIGIIDESGRKRKDFDINKNREVYRDAYTPFHRLVFSVKRLLGKIPGGESRFASYAAALYLIKEKYSVSEKKILKGLSQLGIDPTDLMVEESNWFVLPNGQLSPGVYKLKYEKVSETADMNIVPHDKIRIEDNAMPVGQMFGINIYEATHIRSRQKVYITSLELLR